MPSSPYETPSVLLGIIKAIRAGVPNLPAGTTQIVAGAQVSTITQIEAELDGYIAVYQAEADAEAAYKKAIKAREDLAVTAVPRFEAIRASLKSMLGKKNPDLTKLGLQPDKTPAPLTVNQKETKVALGLATRKARGTMGPKQKAKIKGTLPAAPPAESPTPPAKPGS